MMDRRTQDASGRPSTVAQWLAARRAATHSGLELVDRTVPSGLSASQRAIWVRDTAATGMPQALTFAWSVHGSIDTAQIFDALDRLVEAHEGLRMSFFEENEELRQQVCPPYSVHRQVVAARASDPDVAMEQAAKLSKASVDVSTGEVVGACVVEGCESSRLLLLSMPHLVVDDWSLRVLADDFAKLLQPDPPTTVPIPDAGLLDFVAWEAVTASSDIDSAIRDRRASLASASTLAFAVMPGADPLAQADEADSATFEVPVEVMAAVHRLATTSRVSLFAVLATGYMLTLRNWTGVEDVAVAAPVANRMRPEFERTVGMFANTLVIRAHIDLSATFTGLLHRVSADWLEAMKYAHVPFGALADVARARGVIDGASLPRAAVVLNASTADRPGVVTVSEHARSDSAPSEYDLVLAVRPIDAGGALAELTYRRRVFGEAEVRAFWAAFLQNLSDGLECADLPVRSVHVDRYRRAQVQRTAIGAECPRTFIERLASIVARRPDSLAVLSQGEDLTFGDLFSRALGLAEILRPTLSRDGAVAVVGDRSVASVVGLVGAWLAGAAFVPLDPAAPVERLRMIADDAQVRVIVRGRDGNSLPALEHIAHVDALSQAKPGPGHLPASHPDAAAYVIYTSGSTGQPKGVVGTHGGLAFLLDAVGSLLNGSDAPGLNVMAPTFDGWIWSTVLPLAYGRAVVLAEPSELGDLPTQIQPEFVTVTPSMARPDWLPHSVQTVVLAGEVVTERALATLSTCARLINAYGPTEASICATLADSLAGDEVRTIGRPLPHLRAYVLDDQLTPVPRGGIGELFISGPGVARGYLNRPGETASRFLPDIVSEDGGRMYRSGDLVLVEEDCLLRFHGRIDNQVKIRGFRVELGEVEEAASLVPGVAVAVAVGIPVDGEHAASRSIGELALALRLEDGWNHDHVISTVRPLLTERLPQYMVPNRMVVLDEIPTTTAGKVDRAAILGLLIRTPMPTLTGVGFATPTQRLVAKVWGECIGIEVGDPQVNFFEAGGHSLTAARVVAELRERFGDGLSVRELLSNPTVAMFASALDSLPVNTA
jgi:amino acid adenylation domain-containing protein